MKIAVLIVSVSCLPILAAGCGSAGEGESPAPDAGHRDASEPDTGEPDAAEHDASEPDAGERDASVPGPLGIEEWETSTPEAQGVDSAQLAEVLRTIAQNDLEVHSIFLARNGLAVLNAVYYPFVLSEGLHDFASVTKSITATLIGIAIDKGYIKGVDQKVLEFFPDRTVKNGDARKEAITIEDLLTMRSGFACGHEGEKELWDMMFASDEEWVQYALDLPMEVEPGTEFAYCSPNFHLLSAVLTEATGMSGLEFAREHLFEPLGIRDVIWTPDPQGMTRGWGDLFLRPSDMAKIGYLYLRRGLWNGKPIVSSRWIEKSWQPVTEYASEDEGYGYSWRLPQAFPGVYVAEGRGGQRLIVWPARNVVAVLTGGRDDVDEFAVLLATSMASDSALAENPQALQTLQESLEAAREAPAPEPVPTLPDVAQTISGKRYVLEENILGIQYVSLRFDGGDEAELDIHILDENTGSEVEGPMSVGLDNVYRIFAGAFQGTPIGVKGYWKSDEEFVLSRSAIASFFSLQLAMRFAGDEVSVDMSEESGLFEQTISGLASTVEPSAQGAKGASG